MLFEMFIFCVKEVPIANEKLIQIPVASTRWMDFSVAEKSRDIISQPTSI